MKKELNIKSLIDSIIKKHWKQYAIILTCVFILSAIYALSLPRYYQTEVRIIPETSANGGVTLPGNLSTIASIAGISTASTGQDAINPDIYPDIFNSTTFVLDLLSIKVKPADSAPVSYYKYLTEGQKKPWWATLFPNKKKEKPGSDKINPNHLTKEQDALVKNISNNITCFINKKTGMISLTAQAQDPEVSAQLADSVMAKLQEYIIKYRTTKASRDLKYVSNLYNEAKAKYLAAQKAYAEFSDANQDLVLNQYRITSDRLENEMQLAYNTYSQMTQQLQLAQAKYQERIPAFTVIQDSVVPLRPAGPKRTYIVFFSLFFTTVFVSCYSLYKEIKSHFNQPAPKAEIAGQ